MDPGDEPQFEELDDMLKEIINTVEFCPPPENDTQEIYNVLLSGKCMACRNTLGTDTVLLLNKRGVVAGYCSGPCVQDIAVLGWLQEQEQDVVDSIQFRGGRGDTPEPVDEQD